jgi:YVTN family beta-propeller protein
MSIIKVISLAVICSSIFMSCKKKDTTEVTAPTGNVIGTYILSEGIFGNNNTKLALYNNNNGIVSGDFFLQQNPSMSAGLGDTGNDMIIYGSKLYIAMNVSGNVTVLKASNASFLKKISFINAGVNKQPRYMAAARGKIYVTAYDNKVTVIDTVSLNIINAISVGPSPEGIAASGNYLYVANSGGFNIVPDSTVSLIDLNTEIEIKKIKVGINPNKVEISQTGNVFVSAYGDYANIAPSVFVIDGNTNANGINLGSNFSFSHIRIAGEIAYLYNNYGGSTIKVYNTRLNAVTRNNFIADGTNIATSYGVNIDEQNGDVYIADAGNFINAGSISCYTSAGVKKFSFSIAPGVNPNKVVFIR